MTVFQRSGPASTSNSSSTQSSGDSDLISTASSALRRLHFKSAGGSRANKTKHQQPVPKVVIMGSSTTSNSSNNTINTSTDSANTVATMVTVTDGDYESENEKPFNYIDDVLGTTVSLDREDDFFSGSSSEDMHPGPPPPTPLLGACQKEQRFIFIKTEEDDDDDDDNDNDYTFTLKKTKATVHRSMADDDVVPSASPTKKQKPKSSVILPRKAVGQNNINHTPPPDLRVDFFSENDSLTPVALMEDSQDVLESSALRVGTNGSNLDLGEVGGERVVLAATSSSVLVKRCGGAGGGVSEKAGASSSQTNISSQPVVNTTTNPLSLAGASSALARHQQSTALVVQHNSVIGSPTVSTVLLKNCSVACVSVEGKQPGLSKQQQQQREDNMKQLLDVANTLTLQELHDFEMKYGSPHHSRSQSVKTPGSRSNSGRPNYLCLPQQRSRVASMPNTGVEEEYYRLRHFSITGKGVVNRGDSLKSRRSRSNNSVTSSNSSHSTEHLTTVNPAPAAGGSSYPGSARTSATASLASSRESSTSNPGPTPYRVVMLGSAGVGKSSLINQFMTSEYLHAYDTSLDDEFGEKSVSVLLDGEESELTFIDHPCAEMSPENCITTYEPHAYCVVYSTVDRASLLCAEEILQSLWKNDSVSSKAVILVGNKTDLVRSRTVTTEEGKNMATSYDCKFIETSVGINHNVDELLVGILTQIRLKLENPERARDLFRKRSCSRKKNRNKSPLGGIAAGTGPAGGHKPYRGSRTSTSLKVKGLLGKVWSRDSKSKSCENLHVL